MLWTYDYAIPHGLIYKLNKTKVEKLTPEMVEEDFRFWKEYKTRLLNDPAYKKRFRCPVVVLEIAHDDGEHLQVPQDAGGGGARLPGKRWSSGR